MRHALSQDDYPFDWMGEPPKDFIPSWAYWLGGAALIAWLPVAIIAAAIFFGWRWL